MFSGSDRSAFDKSCAKNQQCRALSADGLQRRVESLAAAAHLRANGGTTSADEGQMTAEDLAGAYSILKSQAEAVHGLQHVLTKVNRDMSILSESQVQQVH